LEFQYVFHLVYLPAPENIILGLASVHISMRRKDFLSYFGEGIAAIIIFFDAAESV
jgi:hypothetical protein